MLQAAIETITRDRDEGRGHAFAAARREWLAARSEIAGLEAVNSHDDAAVDQALERIQIATFGFANARASKSHHILDKFEALEHAIIEMDRIGRPADGRHLALLASFKLDLMRAKITAVAGE